MADNTVPDDETFGLYEPADTLGLRPAPPELVKPGSGRAGPGPAVLERMRKANDWVYTDAIDAAADGFGNDPIGNDPDTEKLLRDSGVFNDYQTGNVSALRTVSEAIQRPISAVTDLFFRSISATVKGTASLLGSGVTLATGEETEGERTKREAENFANFLLLDGGTGLTIPKISPMGRPYDVNIGRLPTAETFKVASDNLASPTIPIKAPEIAGMTSEKQLQFLYDEHGLFPQEVVDAAKTDITISQDLAGGQVPRAFAKDLVPLEDVGGGGVGGGEPPRLIGESKATEPKPEPPKEGSVEEARQKILDQISVGEHTARRSLTLDALYTQIFDDLHPVKVAQELARKETESRLKAEAEGKIDIIPLRPSEDPYLLYRTARGTWGKADQMLVNATFDYKTFENNGLSLKAVLEPVAADLNPFRAYITASRILELETRGIKHGFDLEAARKVVSSDVKKFERISQDLIAYQNRLIWYLRDSGIVSDKSYNAMLQANKQYFPFYKLLDPTLSIVAKAGGSIKALSPRNPLEVIKNPDGTIIDPLESIIKNTYAYIALAEKNGAGLALVDILKDADVGFTSTGPMFAGGAPKKPAVPVKPGTDVVPAAGQEVLQGEVLPPEGGVQAQWEAALGKEAGKGLSVIEDVKKIEDPDPIYSIILKEFGIEDDGLNAVIHHTANRPQEGGQITVFRNGKLERYRISDPELLIAWRGLDSFTANLLQRILAKPAALLRGGVTLSPEFNLRNMVRDFMSAFINTSGAIFTPLSTVKGVIRIVRKDAIYQDWLKGGGANAALVSMDRRYIQESLFKLNPEHNMLKNAWNLVGSPFRGLQMISQLLENATRVGIFEKVTRGRKTKDTILEGAFASREGTLDFARVGASMHAYRLMTAFANPQIQGIDRIVRAFKDHPIETSVKIAAGVSLPSALLWWANHDDPRWQEIPDYQRDTGWIIFTDKNIYRIPKPPILGVLFGSSLERTLDGYLDANPRAFEAWSKSMVKEMSFSIIPTFASPAVEQATNRSQFSGAPLIPDRLEKQLPEYQYTPYTTELAKRIGSLMGAFPGMRNAAMDDSNPFHGVARALTSPILIENYVRGWTGGIGTYILKGLDFDMRKLGILPDPVKPIWQLADYPIIRAFVVRYPSSTAQSIQTFYNRNDANAKVMATFNARAQLGDYKSALAIQETHGLRFSLTSIQNTLGQMSRIIQLVQANPNMNEQDKRQIIDTTYFRMIELAKAGNKMLDQIDKRIEQ